MGMNGHVAVAVMTTVICNVVGIFTIPLYLEWLVYSDVNVNFDIGNMMLKLFYTLFIPLAVSWLSRNLKLKIYGNTYLYYLLLLVYLSNFSV